MECGKPQPCLVCLVCPCVFEVMLESCLVLCGRSWLVPGWRCVGACVMHGRCMAGWWWTGTVVVALVVGLAWAGWSWSVYTRWVVVMSWCGGVPVSNCLGHRCWMPGGLMCCERKTWSVGDGMMSCGGTDLCVLVCGVLSGRWCHLVYGWLGHPGRRWSD